MQNSVRYSSAAFASSIQNCERSSVAAVCAIRYHDELSAFASDYYTTANKLSEIIIEVCYFLVPNKDQNMLPSAKLSGTLK